MKARIIHRALPAVLAVAALGIAAPTAGAAVSLTPPSYDFGGQTVGTTSPPQTFTLSATCTNELLGVCILPASLIPAVSTSVDFAQTNNCPGLLLSAVYLSPASCSINVTFTPTAAGARLGTITGASGLTSSLAGTGLAPPTPTPTPTTTTTGQRAAAIKKCKKKFAGKAKAKKRKKCIKKAKKLPV